MKYYLKFINNGVKLSLEMAYTAYLVLWWIKSRLDFLGGINSLVVKSGIRNTAVYFVLDFHHHFHPQPHINLTLFTLGIDSYFRQFQREVNLERKSWMWEKWQGQCIFNKPETYSHNVTKTGLGNNVVTFDVHRSVHPSLIRMCWSDCYHQGHCGGSVHGHIQDWTPDYFKRLLCGNSDCSRWLWQQKRTKAKTVVMVWIVVICEVQGVVHCLAWGAGGGAGPVDPDWLQLVEEQSGPVFGRDPHVPACPLEACLCSSCLPRPLIVSPFLPVSFIHRPPAPGPHPLQPPAPVQQVFKIMFYFNLLVVWASLKQTAQINKKK